MPPIKSKLICIEGTFDAPIDGASFYRATVTHDKVRARTTYCVIFYDRAEENKRSVVTIGGNRSLSVKVKDSDTSNIKELIVRKALEK